MSLMAREGLNVFYIMFSAFKFSNFWWFFTAAENDFSFLVSFFGLK